MTAIQRFIEKAIVGGWRPEAGEFSVIGFDERHFEYQLRSIGAGRPSALRMMAYEAVLLDPKAWQAVAKVAKWYEGYYGPEWRHHMHQMIDALVEGQTLEAYVQCVLDKAQSTRR